MPTIDESHQHVFDSIERLARFMAEHDAESALFADMVLHASRSTDIALACAARARFIDSILDRIATGSIEVGE